MSEVRVRIITFSGLPDRVEAFFDGEWQSVPFEVVDEKLDPDFDWSDPSNFTDYDTENKEGLL